ncbi:MAG TPA: permease-like cell division protein FtsX [Longimicrobiales bacterium]|nr:permease-like cell division protein FtsX [Longimicrobiales bacterium]
MKYIVREALAAFRRAPLLTALSAAMIALSLFVVGLFGVAAYNVQQVVERIEERVEVVAYLRDGAPPDAIRLARAEIESFPEVAAVNYISKEEALEVANRELGELSAVLVDADVNPLPASFEISLRPGHRTPDVVAEVAERLSAYAFVEDVQFGQEWLDKIFVLRRIAGTASTVLGLAFAAVAALIIGAAVRMAIYARRDEIAIMRLVGATPGFIQGPFLLEGFLTGLLGGLLAAPATYGVYHLLSGAVVELQWVPGYWVVCGVVIGAVLGLIASALAVHRHLKGT